MEAWVTEGVWLVTGDGAQYLPWSLVIIVCVLWTIVTALLFYQAGSKDGRRNVQCDQRN